MNSLDEYFQSATGGSTYPPGGAHWRGTEGQSDSGSKYFLKHALNNGGSLLVFILYVQLLERGKNENWGVEFVWVTPGASFLPSPLFPLLPLFPPFPPFPQTCKLSIAIYQSHHILSGPIAGSAVERPLHPAGV